MCCGDDLEGRRKALSRMNLTSGHRCERRRMQFGQSTQYNFVKRGFNTDYDQ